MLLKRYFFALNKSGIIKYNMKKIKIPVEISARHCHLSKSDLEKLFGGVQPGEYELHRLKQLSQPSDFACVETVDMQIGAKKFEKVRVVGPVRVQTQVEISITDAIGSGIIPPIRLSGDLKGSAAAVLFGPAGQIELEEGLIVAKRHIHCATDEAKKLKLKTGDKVSVEVMGERPVIFKDVVVRTGENYKLCLHLDADEGNAAGINKMGEGFIIKK